MCLAITIEAITSLISLLIKLEHLTEMSRNNNEIKVIRTTMNTTKWKRNNSEKIITKTRSEMALIFNQLNQAVIGVLDRITQGK